LEKTRKKLLKAIVLLMLPVTALAQSKSGLESYNQLGDNAGYLWVPVVHYQHQKGFYSEFRYNYEDLHTGSVFMGKVFEIDRRSANYSITPMIGFSAGNFNGISIALNAELEWKKLYISSQMQYSFSLQKEVPGFYFNWSEAGYAVTDWFILGPAFQYTLQKGAQEFQPGFFMSASAGKFSIPLYVLHAGGGDPLVILGLNYEFSLRRKQSNKGLSLP
jgi:hypothetical protein